MMKWNDQAVLEMHLYFRQQGQSMLLNNEAQFICV